MSIIKMLDWEAICVCVPMVIGYIAYEYRDKIAKAVKGLFNKKAITEK